MARAGNQTGREGGAPWLNSRKDEFEIEVEMPQNLRVTDEELAILETYLGDIIAQILRDKAAED